MATITVEGIPDALLARLAIAAAGNGRCLNSEVIVHLARAAGSPAGLPGHGAEALRGGCGGRSRCRCGRRGAAAAVGDGWGGPASSQQPRGVRV
jgi:plasmid stability protein